MYELLTKEEINKLEDAVNRDPNPVLYLAIDPGTKNGVCGYDVKGYLQFMFTVHADDMIEFLDKFHKIQKCICESFALFPDKAMQQVRSDMETSRVIGRIEGWTARNKIELIMQAPKIKPTGYAWLGKKPLPKSNPRNHSLDAHAHFTYWGVQNGVISPADLLKRSKVGN